MISKLIGTRFEMVEILFINYRCFFIDNKYFIIWNRNQTKGKLENHPKIMYVIH